MRFKTFSGLVYFLLLSFLFTACKKDAGPGGLATIQGKVYGRDITTSGTLRGEGYLGDQRVFISVSGNAISFDDVRTSYDGSYRFSFLRKGTYDVWAFSDCDTCAFKQRAVLQNGIIISDKKEVKTLPDFEIIY